MEKREFEEKMNADKTEELSLKKSKSNALYNDNVMSELIGNKSDLELKSKYDGLTDIEDEKPKEKLNVGTCGKIKENSSNFKNQIFRLTDKPVIDSQSESSSNSFSSRENSLDDTENSSETEISDYYNFGNENTKLAITELRPMETLTWLRDHGMGKMANLISREREDSKQQKSREDSILGIYNADIKNQDLEYLKKLFITSLGGTYDKIDFLNENVMSRKLEKNKISDNEYKNTKTIECLENINDSREEAEKVETISKKCVKPKLINRIEVTEEGISGENALAFQKYIRDLQEEIKMKDEKLRLREMERDNARLTRDQLTRAVKSSLEIGNGVGKLDYLFKNIIKRNLLYSFRILQLQARVKLRNKLGCEMFAGASLLKHIVLKRLKYAFGCIHANTVSKKDDLFWRKDIVNTEGVVGHIVSKFRNILLCFKLVGIVQHNHTCALKKFLYIWTKCSGLKNNNDSYLYRGWSPFKKKNLVTLRELKIAAETDLKKLSSKDKMKLNNTNKRFFDKNTKTITKPDLKNPMDTINNEILRNINDKLSIVPNERLDLLSMLVKDNKEQMNIDIARSNALNHLSEIIDSVSGKEEIFKSSCENTLNNINNLAISYKDHLISSFKNLILNKDKLDIINEIEEHTRNKFKQPIKVPDFIERDHLKLLEDFYSNPFYHIFVNEYNKRLFLDYNDSSSEEDEFENYEAEVDENTNENECDIFYYNSNSEDKQLNVQQQTESNINIDPEVPVKLEITRTEDLYIQDEDQFETVYYCDQNYFQIYEDCPQDRTEYQYIEEQVRNQDKPQKTIYDHTTDELEGDRTLQADYSVEDVNCDLS